MNAHHIRWAQGPYARYQTFRSWPLAWSRTTKWRVRGAPRHGLVRALYDVFTKAVRP